MNATDYQKQAGRTDLIDYAPVFARLHDDGFTGMRLLHAGLGMTTEAGEFVDALKKRLMYGKELDESNLKEELGDLMWYIALACNALNLSLEDVMATNILKLYARYPDKFTEKQALMRNLKVEQDVLKAKVEL